MEAVHCVGEQLELQDQQADLLEVVSVSRATLCVFLQRPELFGPILSNGFSQTSARRTRLCVSLELRLPAV